MTEAIDALDGQDGRSRRAKRTGKRRTPGRPRALDHDTVVRTAVQIADNDGVAALTMARLASELGVAVMTLYTYIPTKDQLLDEVVDAVLGQTSLPMPPQDPALWRAVLLDTFVEFHDVMLAHWKLVETVGTRTSIGPAVTGWLEAVLRILETTGFDAAERVTIYRELLGYLLGDLQLRISHLPGLRAGQSGTDVEDEAEFPLVEQATKQLHQQVSREHFAAGLRRILESLPDPGTVRPVTPTTPLPVLTSAGIVSIGSDAGAADAPTGLREQAVLMVSEVRDRYESESAAIRSVADKLGVSSEILAKWVLRARVADSPPATADADQLAELLHLRTENQELRRANEILKSASAFFAAELDRPQWRW